MSLLLSAIPNFLLGFLGAKSAYFNFNDDRLSITLSTGEVYNLPIDTVDETIIIRRGFIFNKISVVSKNSKVNIWGFPDIFMIDLELVLKKSWASNCKINLKSIVDEIRSSLITRYPRTSNVDKFKPIAKRIATRLDALVRRGWISSSEDPFFELIFSTANLNDYELNKLRKNFLDSQKEKFSDFFDNVESKPLTECQREACIIDEDNNLVLAGAGTGKTSVIVGRAGYLVNSGMAVPNEILLLAYGRKAAEEMQERIESRLGGLKIKASTFHKLGKSIIASVEGGQPMLSMLVEDENALKLMVNQWFEELLNSTSYRGLVIEYFSNLNYSLANPFDFTSEGEYYDYIRANDIRTLKGELVKSLGECLVANHLFKLGIEYIYENPYEIVTKSPFHRQYKPDFYLPEHNIYIEYWGIDRDGGTAPYIDSKKYAEDMKWKRDLHKRHGTTLIELYHYENAERYLFESLNEQIKSFDIELNPLPPEAILNTLREQGSVNNFSELLVDLLKRYKANCFVNNEVDHLILGSKNPKQFSAALKLLQPIVDKYNLYLTQEDAIDFDDMIGTAIKYVSTGRFVSPWKYILVDEFQDISDPRARLIRALRDSTANCSIFGVGDDWQAIYRFSGSDLSFTTSFASIFGPTSTTTLDTTFRFNNSISNVASKFVQKNPIQIDKKLKTLVSVDKPAVSLYRSNAQNNHDDVVDTRLQKVLEKIESSVSVASSVFLLARFSFILPEKAHISQLNRQFKNIKIESYTIHASKGKEADFIVLLGLEKGKHGFPSEKVTHPLLESLLPPEESFAHAEERRLFYVAMTRAKKRAYLIADMRAPSSFINELIVDKYPIEVDEFDISIEQKFSSLLSCVKCKTGSILKRTSQFGDFYSCNHYPLCSHKERGCENCGMSMARHDRFKVCISADCESCVPVCPMCGAEMVAKKGKYGVFWGCRNYRPEGESCNHTEKEIAFNLRQLKKAIFEDV